MILVVIRDPRIITRVERRDIGWYLFLFGGGSCLEALYTDTTLAYFHCVGHLNEDRMMLKR